MLVLKLFITYYAFILDLKVVHLTKEKFIETLLSNHLFTKLSKLLEDDAVKDQEFMVSFFCFFAF